MARDVRERRCGCLYYKVGPPVLCPKHEKKTKVKERKSLRRLVTDQCEELDHELNEWSEYPNKPGKWTAYCQGCGLLVIVYDEPPPVGDQVAGWALTQRCRRVRVRVDTAPTPAETVDEFELET